MSIRIIAGIFKGRKIKTPKSGSTRPTQAIVREAVFNICQNEIANSKFLDLYAGSGAVGLEALSRGAKAATFIEQDKTALSCIIGNIKLLDLEEKAKVLPLSLEKGVEKLARENVTFDLIYIDPPYKAVFNFSLIEALLREGSLVIYESGTSYVEKPLQSLNLIVNKKFGASHVAIFSNSD